MKKNLKSKILLTLGGYILIHTFLFCEVAQAQAEIVSAIQDAKAKIVAALTGFSAPDTTTINVINKLDSNNKEMINQFDTTFRGIFTGGVLTGPSTLDSKINTYAQSFYSMFTTKDFSALDFSAKNKEIGDAVKKLLSQEIGYNTQKNLVSKTNDNNDLLAQPIEMDNNNIDRASLSLPADGTTPYGSLDNNSPLAPNAPTLGDLIGVDSYANKSQEDKAKLFISYLINSMPAPKNFYIPSKTEAVNNKITLYLPYASENKPYKVLPNFISTKMTFGTTTEYDKMVKFLNSDAKYYQKYKMKIRSLNILRTLYLENIYRLYKARFKDLNDKNSKSLVEKEKEAAYSGLNKEYYVELKKKTVADVNLETLYAINKLAYFLYKLHEDNERSALLIAASGLRLATPDIQDEQLYIRPISTLIENRCWDEDNLDDNTKAICADPMSQPPKANLGG